MLCCSATCCIHVETQSPTLSNKASRLPHLKCTCNAWQDRSRTAPTKKTSQRRQLNPNFVQVKCKETCASKTPNQQLKHLGAGNVHINTLLWQKSQHVGSSDSKSSETSTECSDELEERMTQMNQTLTNAINNPMLTNKQRTCQSTNKCWFASALAAAKFFEDQSNWSWSSNDQSPF